MAQCYYPSGNISPEDKPCNEQAENSSCCRGTHICLDNGYCMGATDDGANVITRATCTDSSFKDRSCAMYCKDFNPTEAAVLFLYHFDSPSTYCCGPPDTSSGTCVAPTLGSNAPFPLPNANVITNRTTGAALPLNSTQLIPTVAAAAPSDAVVSTPSVTVTASATAAATSVVVKPNTARDAAIGAGIGVPFGVALLLSLVALYWQRRKFRQAESKWRRERDGLLKREAMAYGPRARSAGPYEADTTMAKHLQYFELGPSNTPAVR